MKRGVLGLGVGLILGLFILALRSTRDSSNQRTSPVSVATISKAKTSGEELGNAGRLDGVPGSTSLSKSPLGEAFAARNRSGAPSLWRRAVSAADIGQEALVLVASEDPNDWLRAVSLHLLCISGLERSDLSPGRTAQLDSTFGQPFREVTAYFTARCGELGHEFLSRTPDLQARATAAKAPLALAPSLTNATIDKGMTEEQLARLSDLLNDGDAATLWLTRNVGRLDSVIQNLGETAGLSKEDLQTASVVTLCLRGLDCGKESVVSLKLCVNTSGKVCSIGGPLAALEGLDPQRVRAITNLAQKIDAALNQANPEGLGIRRRAS